MESESSLSPFEYEQLERASSTIVEILRACRARPALTTLNEQTSIQTTRFNSTGSILPQQVSASNQRHSTGSLPSQRQLLSNSKPLTPIAQISQLHQQFLQQQQQQNTLNQLSLANVLNPQAALLLAATAQQRAAMVSQPQPTPLAPTNNLLTALASLSQQQHQLAAQQTTYIPSTNLSSLNNNNNNSIATSLQQLAQINASNNPSPKFDDMLRKAIMEFEKRGAWTTAVQTPR